MNKIKLLDDKIINKIAAGEVVEKPASIIKELVENSIDANSTLIIIEIKKGGKSFIRITDNGTGISKGDLELALKRHSTSKIAKSEDLNNILTLGFRGEALASMAAVSQMQIITKTKDSITGSEINVNAGNIINKTDVGCPQGTTIIVKNIFYNIPVRLKFLKSDSIETSYITEIVQKLALSYPNKSFKYIKDDKVIFTTPGKGDLQSTIYSLFGKNYTKSLINIEDSFDNVKLSGFISNTSLIRGNRKQQFIFVNNRVIKNKNISSAVEDAYKSLIPINKHPVVFLNIEISPSLVDVNVHPAKVEIRFAEGLNIERKVYNCIINVLKKQNLIPTVKLNNYNTSKDDTTLKQENFIDIIKSKSDNNIVNVKVEDNSLTITEEDKINTKIKDYNTNCESNKKLIVKEEGIDFSHIVKDNDYDELFDNNPNDNQFKKSINNTINEEYYKQEQNINKIFSNIKYLGRLFSTYILVEDISTKTFYIIDQHAAHERIMYEKYKKQFTNEVVVSQNLLIPLVINVSHMDIEAIRNNKVLLNNLGFEIEEFGINTVMLRSIPLIFGEPDIKSLFIDLIDNLTSNIKSNYDLRIEKIIKMACTNAIKGGDKIQEVEVNRLLEDLQKVENSFTCPHGRPIMIKMSKYEIEKEFKRIQ